MPVTNPYSPLGEPIYNLFMIVTVIGAIVLIGVSGALLFFAIRYRDRPGAPPAAQSFGNRKLEIIWIVVPLVIVLSLFGMSISTAREIEPPTNGRDPDLRIIGHQWWWEVVYPQSGVVTANEIHIPVGQRLLVQLESVDVIHSFWVPNLGRKKDAVPGHPNRLWLAANTPGTFEGACAEYCGVQHAWMRINVIAQPQAEFDTWLQAQAAPNTRQPTAQAQQGGQMFAHRTCANCHAVGGTAATPNIGPNLHRLADRQTLGAGVIANTPDDLAAWLRDPQAIKPASLMPNLKLSDDEIAALIAYLEAQR